MRTTSDKWVCFVHEWAKWLAGCNVLLLIIPLWCCFMCVCVCPKCQMSNVGVDGEEIYTATNLNYPFMHIQNTCVLVWPSLFFDLEIFFFFIFVNGQYGDINLHHHHHHQQQGQLYCFCNSNHPYWTSFFFCSRSIHLTHTPTENTNNYFTSDFLDQSSFFPACFVIVFIWVDKKKYSNSIQTHTTPHQDK